MLWWIVAVLGISVAPFLFIRHGVRRGHYSDHLISRREQRLIPLLFVIGCMTISFALLYFLGASHLLVATMTAVIVACSISLLITRYWKISLHLVGIAGAVTVCVLMFGVLFLLLAPLVAIVAWARWQGGAHTLLQAAVGAALAVGVTMTIFWMFGVF